LSLRDNMTPTVVGLLDGGLGEVKEAFFLATDITTAQEQGQGTPILYARLADGKGAPLISYVIARLTEVVLRDRVVGQRLYRLYRLSYGFDIANLTSMFGLYCSGHMGGGQRREGRGGVESVQNCDSESRQSPWPSPSNSQGNRIVVHFW